MGPIPQSAVRWLALAAAGFLVLTALAPRKASADTNLTVGGTAVIANAAGDAVRLRSQPGYDAAILDLFPEGTTVDVLNDPTAASDGTLWYRVAVAGRTGYMLSDFLATDAPALSGDPGSTALTTARLNLRAGPSTADDILLVMPQGSTATLTGGQSNGFRAVSYRGTAGWASASYLDTSGGGSPPDGASSSNASRSAVTTSDLNLRAGPSTADDVLLVIPTGATVAVTGDPLQGFYPVTYRGQTGWASGTYLDFGGQPASNGGGGSLIVWPFASGAAWTISQGYNGPFGHQNESSTWQYYYSFDLVPVDGNAAGQPIYAPVTGTIRWIDQAYGGMSIDMGNGYAFAYFHTVLAPGLAPGQAVQQGQYLGAVAPPGEGGNGGFPHCHISIWQTNDGGNWDRHAVPFTGQLAISGMDFPDTGGESQYRGTVIYP